MSRIRRSRALVALLVAIVTSTAVGLPAVADLNLILGASAQVAYTNGDGVNVRDTPGFNSNVIWTLGEGVEVIVHDGPVAANDGSYWYYISSGGAEGWVIADYLALPGVAGTSDSIWGQIAWTGGDGVNVRAQAMLDSAVVTTLHEGTSITILAGPEWDANGNAWTLVAYEGVQGWVLDDYVAWYGLAGTDDSDRSLDGGWTAYVAFTDGAGLRLRGSASYDGETLIVMPDGAQVTVFGTQIYGSDGAEWWNVEYEGILGYAMGYYFGTEAPAAAVAEPVAAEPVAAEPSLDVWAGANAAVAGTNGEGVNLRYEWGYNAGVATWLAEGSIVWVVDGPVWGDDGSPWFQVDAAGLIGWVHGGYLVHTTDAPAADVDVAVSEPEPITPAFTADPVGDSIVNEGLSYVGLPYVWGGTTPSGFDCSGFLQYVLTQVFGYNFTRILEVQAVSGEHVDPANLTPGDLVFFQNTYTWGLSHAGIYIGDGQFVHAGSERTGVTISNMWDDYWGSRYYTARRVRS